MAKKAQEGGSSKRTEIVTFRIDPRLKYLADLAARSQRRPLSSFVEWAVQQAVSEVILRKDRDGNEVTVMQADERLELWDPDEPDRFIRLATSYPELLTHEEQVLWKVVRETGYLWKGSFVGDPPGWGWIADLRSIHLDRLRHFWPLIREVAEGTRLASDLPPLPKPPSQKTKSR